MKRPSKAVGALDLDGRAGFCCWTPLTTREVSTALSNESGIDPVREIEVNGGQIGGRARQMRLVKETDGKNLGLVTRRRKGTPSRTSVGRGINSVHRLPAGSLMCVRCGAS